MMFIAVRFVTCFIFSKASNPVGHEQTLRSLINWECFQFTVNLVHFITFHCSNIYLPVVYCILLFSPIIAKKDLFILDKSPCYPIYLPIYISEWIIEVELNLVVDLQS